MVTDIVTFLKIEGTIAKVIEYQGVVRKVSQKKKNCSQLIPQPLFGSQVHFFIFYFLYELVKVALKLLIYI
jgi:hypothetical protein